MPSIARQVLLVALAVAVAGCGDGSVCFGGDCGAGDDTERTVTVNGTTRSIRPPNAIRDVMVFVYTGLDSSDRQDGPAFDTYKDAEVALVEADAFDVSRVSRGGLTVIFARDTESEPNGVIDPGDECSVLLDGGKLSNVAGGRTVKIEDADVDFAESSCSSPPPAVGCGCTRARNITVTVERESGTDS